jgi:hypothetical protein
MNRPVSPWALLCVGALLGWAIAQPFPTPAHHGNNAQHEHRTRPSADQTGPNGGCAVAQADS